MAAAVVEEGGGAIYPEFHGLFLLSLRCSFQPLGFGIFFFSSRLFQLWGRGMGDE
ncbi:hypothetical protein RHMOL_Rhmol01G0325800 [Rhododendron molle]|uniref:Uncharacterized protein n=1 Tax=Rhododendron molle TaxID=49168 RepID=A0ACC0Q7S0_RHOML|nr:hypothetical protein RHMOL_Rhmol01G0325800 [Rhododendron molle]